MCLTHYWFTHYWLTLLAMLKVCMIFGVKSKMYSHLRHTCQGRSNRYCLYGQSRIGFWPELKLLLKQFIVKLAAGMNSASDLEN